jgi:hypothetical protein
VSEVRDELLAAVGALVEGVAGRGPGQGARLNEFADALLRSDPAAVALHPNLGVFLLRVAATQADPAARAALEEIAGHFTAGWFKLPGAT